MGLAEGTRLISFLLDPILQLADSDLCPFLFDKQVVEAVDFINQPT